MASQLPNKISKIFTFFLLHNSRGRGIGGPRPLNRADWNKRRLISRNLDPLGSVPRSWQPGGREETHPVCDEVTEKTSASHLDHENRIGHGWINAALSAITASLPISECLTSARYLKILSYLVVVMTLQSWVVSSFYRHNPALPRWRF